MRLLAWVLAAALLLLAVLGGSHAARLSRDSQANVAIYDPNPAHLWNRLHSALYIRDDIPSTAQVPDALDPPLWPSSSHLLAKPSHERVIKILDEFLETHSEHLIQDPVKHAMLQRDLWSVFDWSAHREPPRLGEPSYEKETQELQTRLAEIMRRLALSSQAIRALPSNYAQAVGSGEFAKQYDPQHRDRAFLPPDLFDARSSWVQVAAQGSTLETEPAAAAHAEQFSRSSFVIFMRVPSGRKATFDYLRTLWDFPLPWIPRSDGGAEVRDQATESRELPRFPPGTQFALVRQMMLFDNQGRLQPTPVTESIQFRFYRSIAPNNEINSGSREESLAAGQDFYEVVLTRPRLFAGETGGLRATGRKEKAFALLNSFGADEGNSPGQFQKLDNYAPTLESCALCHRGGGINSVNSRRQFLRPNWLIHDDPGSPANASATNVPETKWWEYDQSVTWKQNRFDWGLLTGYWRASAPLH